MKSKNPHGITILKTLLLLVENIGILVLTSDILVPFLLPSTDTHRHSSQVPHYSIVVNQRTICDTRAKDLTPSSKSSITSSCAIQLDFDKRNQESAALGLWDECSVSDARSSRP